MINPVGVVPVKKSADYFVSLFGGEILLAILQLIVLNLFDCNFSFCSFEALITLESIVQHLEFSTLIIVQAMRRPDPRLCLYFELRHIGLVVGIASDLHFVVRLSSTHYK
jgi:hypothetical protein